MKSITRAAVFAVFLLVPSFASAVYTQTVDTTYSFGLAPTYGGYVTGACAGIGCIANTVIYIINSVLVPVLFAVSFIVFLYGVAKAYIFSKGEPAEVGKGHKLIMWGIIGFAIMVSLWGLVNVVANTFSLGGYGAPLLPTSY